MQGWWPEPVYFEGSTLFIWTGEACFFSGAAAVYFQGRVLFIVRGGACLFKEAGPVYLKGRGPTRGVKKPKGIIKTKSRGRVCPFGGDVKR